MIAYTFRKEQGQVKKDPPVKSDGLKYGEMIL
jgi:hypothetical protein